MSIVADSPVFDAFLENAIPDSHARETFISEFGARLPGGRGMARAVVSEIRPSDGGNFYAVEMNNGRTFLMDPDEIASRDFRVGDTVEYDSRRPFQETACVDIEARPGHAAPAFNLRWRVAR